jgi:hypothetical protein
MVNKDPRILGIPERMATVSADLVVPGARDLLLLLKQQVQLFSHDLLPVCDCQYV